MRSCLAPGVCHVMRHCSAVCIQCSLAFTPPPPPPQPHCLPHTCTCTHSLVEEGLQPVQNFLEPDKSELLVKQTPAVPSKEQEEFSICVPVTEADGNGVVGGGGCPLYSPRGMYLTVWELFHSCALIFFKSSFYRSLQWMTGKWKLSTTEQDSNMSGMFTVVLSVHCSAVFSIRQQLYPQFY